MDYSKHLGGLETIQSPLDKIPVYQRSGSIIPLQLRVRRSSTLMINDPYTLVIAVDDNNKAVGDVYLDDTVTYIYIYII